MPHTWNTETSYKGRVEIAPHLDRWMKGDRFGEVVAASKGAGNNPDEYMLRVRMDRSGDLIQIRESNVTYL